MDRRLHSARALCLATILVLAVAGCGGASHKSDPASARLTPLPASAALLVGGPVAPGEVIAEVGKVQISKAALDRGVLIEQRTEIPGDHQSHVRQEISKLIAAEWVLGEAAAKGLAPSEQQVRQRYEQVMSQQYPTQAKFQAFLSRSGESVPDLLLKLKEQLAINAMFEKLRSSSERVTPAVAVRYYAQNKAQYVVSEKRDMGMIRTKTAAEATRVKRELQSGVSFASVAKRLKSEQPRYTVQGLLNGLRPHIYAEKELNDAIFSAKPHVLSGPVSVQVSRGVHFRNPADIKNIDGYYVFELTKIEPAHQQSFAQVKAAIARQLPYMRYKTARGAFVKSWREHWKAKTNCRPGYVVHKCRQATHPLPGEAPEDPYTLN
jgi:foldase protein PrsA